MTEYLTITPAGSIMVTQCVGTGHPHTGPDVPLGQQCPTHHVQWVWCAGCQLIWCPGVAGRNNGHEGTVMPIAAAKGDVEPLEPDLIDLGPGLVGPV